MTAQGVDSVGVRVINIDSMTNTDTFIQVPRQEQVSQEESLAKFNLKAYRDREVKLLREIKAELDSVSKKLKDQLTKKEDTEDDAFEDIGSSMDTILVKLNQDLDSPDDFNGLLYDTEVVGWNSPEFSSAGNESDWQHDALHETEDYFVVLDQPIQFEAGQNTDLDEVVQDVIETVNVQGEAPPIYDEVADECSEDKQVVETRPSKRIRVTKQDVGKDDKPMKF